MEQQMREFRSRLTVKQVLNYSMVKESGVAMKNFLGGFAVFLIAQSAYAIDYSACNKFIGGVAFDVDPSGTASPSGAKGFKVGNFDWSKGVMDFEDSRSGNPRKGKYLFQKDPQGRLIAVSVVYDKPIDTHWIGDYDINSPDINEHQFGIEYKMKLSNNGMVCVPDSINGLDRKKLFSDGWTFAKDLQKHFNASADFCSELYGLFQKKPLLAACGNTSWDGASFNWNELNTKAGAILLEKKASMGLTKPETWESNRAMGNYVREACGGTSDAESAMDILTKYSAAQTFNVGSGKGGVKGQQKSIEQEANSDDTLPAFQVNTLAARYGQICQQNFPEDQVHKTVVQLRAIESSDTQRAPGAAGVPR
jgi:hypothetical protein